MIRSIAVCFVVLVSHLAVAQTVTVEVWKLAKPGRQPEPAIDAAVRVARADSQPLGPQQPPQIPRGGGPLQNQYVLDGSLNGPLIDVTTRVEDYHMWVVRDLLVSPGGEQKINVQLFRYDYPIRAPQCFALKTQYELLFRLEQRLSPQPDLKVIQHRARLKYAAGVLALPNPSRQHVQSQETRQMLADMTEEDRDELNGMLNGLFDLYEMDSFAQFAPSIWRSQYTSPGGQAVQCEVRILGNRGTYSTSDGAVHLLENIDIFNEENSEGGSSDVITGNWRFDRQNDSAGGTFRWVVDGSGSHFDGTYHIQGRNNSLSWEGDRIELAPPPE